MYHTLQCYIRVCILIIHQVASLLFQYALDFQISIINWVLWVVKLQWVKIPIRYLKSAAEHCIEIVFGIKVQRKPRCAVVIFTKYPKLGRCRPKLIPYIGAHNATFLQRIMTENVVRTLLPLKGEDNLDLFAAFEDHCCDRRGSCDCQDKMAFWFERLHKHKLFKDAHLIQPQKLHYNIDSDDGLNRTDTFRKILPQLLSKIQYEELSTPESGLFRSRLNSNMVTGNGKTWDFEDRSQCSSRKPEPSGFTFFRQRGPDVASAMHHAFSALFQRGYDHVALVSGDVPGIDASLLRKTFAAMTKGAEVVLGKTNSGGIYLLSYKASVKGSLNEMLRDMVWNMRTMYAAQVERCTRYNLACATLHSRLTNVDHLQDVAVVEQLYGVPGRILAQESISVVIPCLNEGVAIETTLTNLVRNFSHRCPMQVLIVDGRSNDNTLQSLHNFKRNLFRYGSEGVELEFLTLPLERKSFRAASVLYGLEHARGSYYLILHADTYLPKNWDRYMLGTLSRPGVVAGSFTFQVRVSNEMVGRKDLRWAMRVFVLEMLRNWRARRFELPYGDQGLFLHSYYYRQLGGLVEWPFFEDIELVRRAWQFGHVAVSSAPALTSPRRWFRVGFLRASFLSSLVLLAFRLGVSPEELGKVYNHLKRGSGETREPLT